MMKQDSFVYRNELFKQYVQLAIATSILLSPIYYYIGETSLAITLNIFSIVVIYLFVNCKKKNSYSRNSRIFMVAITVLFLSSFFTGDQEFNSLFYLLLYPIASFSVRGMKEGILWATTFLVVLILLFAFTQSEYNFYSFIFFCVTFFMVSYLLYYYRYFELKNFIEINEELERTVEIRTNELRETNKKLEKLATTDVLTGLSNRGKIDEIIQYEMSRSTRIEKPFGIILLDIDHFKAVNDTFGHLSGDSVLKEVATILLQSIRQSDSAGRWGGEEFIIICPESTQEGIVTLAEHIRTKLEKHPIDTVGNVTASFGTAIFQEGEEGNVLVSRADTALYKAKKNGRNRVEFSF